MIPVYFGDLAGYLDPADGDCGIVLCGASDHESLCAYAGWSDLGRSLAAQGFPVLRFDWHGSGDSLGSSTDPARLDAWRNSLDQSIAYLKQVTGVTRVALVGIRLGALLAIDAMARHDLAALALLAPPATGRSFLRECRAFAAFVATWGKEPPPREGMSLAGFHITKQTMQEISTLDAAGTVPNMPVLMLSPEGHGDVEQIAKRWREAGASVTVAPFPGYSEYFMDATFTKVPDLAFSHVRTWLQEQLAPAPMSQESIAPLPAAALLHHPDFQDEALQFGPSGRLFGVLCTPTRPRPDAPTVMLLNAGRNPHIGWARMGIQIARGLAAEGIASMRIDFASIGNSLTAPDRGDLPIYNLATIEDVRAALDVLGTRGHDRVVLAGLCSGAFIAFHAGTTDARVVGVILGNLQRFVWNPEERLEATGKIVGRPNGAYLRDALRLATWQRAIRGEVAMLEIARTIGERVARKAGRRLGETLFGVAADSPMGIVRSGFAALARRGARALMVFSRDDGGIDELALYMGRNGRDLARYPGMSVAYIENADHNLTPPAARQEFLRLILEFVVAIPLQKQAA